MRRYGLPFALLGFLAVSCDSAEDAPGAEDEGSSMVDAGDGAESPSDRPSTDVDAGADSPDGPSMVMGEDVARDSGMPDAGTSAGDAGMDADPFSDLVVPDECPQIVDFYEASYRFVSGDCGQVCSPPVVSFDRLDGRPWMSRPSITNHLGMAEALTTTTIEGCLIRFTQAQFDFDGVILMSAEGAAVIGEDGVMRGRADVIRYDATGEPSCSGSYDVELVETDDVLSWDPTKPEPVDTSFSDEHADVIALDCENRRQCAGDMIDFSFPAECPDALPNLLDCEQPDNQAAFLETADSCSDLTGCDYGDCAGPLLVPPMI